MIRTEGNNCFQNNVTHHIVFLQCFVLICAMVNSHKFVPSSSRMEQMQRASYAASEAVTHSALVEVAETVG